MREPKREGKVNAILAAPDSLYFADVLAESQGLHPWPATIASLRIA